MQVITDEAILQRAEKFCDQNGTRWETLSEYNRKRYLTRAREQLLDEEANELISRGLFRDPRTGAVARFSLVAGVAACRSGAARTRKPLSRAPHFIGFSSAA